VVRRQVERVFGLDVDGAGYELVGQRDPVVGALQVERPGLRPVAFYSPYEAAAWAVLVARTGAPHARVLRNRIAAQLGVTFDLGGPIVSYPIPARLLELRSLPGLPEEKVRRLHSVAEAALDGRLDPWVLRAMPTDEALATLRTIHGIGDFSARLILLRGVPSIDVFAPEPRLLQVMERRYGPGADLDAISAVWAPYRTWVSVLLRSTAAV